MSKQYLLTTTIPPPSTPQSSSDIFSLAATPTHLFLATGHSSIRIHSTLAPPFDPEEAEDENPYPLVQTLEKVHPLGAHHVAVSADGRVAASAGFGGEVRVWEVREGGEEWVERGSVVPATKGKRSGGNNIEVGEPWAIALFPDGGNLALSTHDGRVHIYSTPTLPHSSDSNAPAPQPTTTYQTSSTPTSSSFALSIDISPSGQYLATGHQNGTIALFNNTTSALAHTLRGLLKPIRTVRFSPSSRYLAAAGDARIIALYDVQSGEQISVLQGHASWIMGLDWSPVTGEWIVSCGYDGKVKVWGMERRECVATLTAAGDGGCLWGVRWLLEPEGGSKGVRRGERFVVGGKGGGAGVYREASGR